MSLSKAFVRSQFPKDAEGLDSAVTAIMDAHGESITREKTKQAELQKTVDELSGTVKEYESTIAELQDDSETEKELAELKAKIEQSEKDHAAALAKANEEHEQTKVAYASEKSNAEMDRAVEAALKESGYSEAAIPLLMKAGYDRDQIKRKEGKFTNLEKFVETLKADPVHKSFFGAMKETGADVGQSHGGNNGVKNPWLKENRNPNTLAEQTRIAKENPELAMQMAQAAGIKLNLQT
jgi:hypothetical protein